MSAEADRVFNLWGHIRPSEHLDGVWVAHCLDVDVVTQGHSPDHAFRMLLEAVAMVIEDDLNRNFEPLTRRAPEELWTRVWEIANDVNAQRLPLTEGLSAPDAARYEIVFQFVMPFRRVRVEENAPPARPELAIARTVQRDSHPTC